MYNQQNYLLRMRYLILFSFLIIIGACKQNSEYEQRVQNELNKEVRNDTLFLGYELGMEQQNFLDHSWDLNQQNIITGTTQIEYPLKELSSDARMVFYPRFHDNKLVRMPIEVSFNSWAIWNREFYSDHLQDELLEYFEELYGTGFIYTEIPDLNRKAWAKIDGNRRILIYPKDDRIVRVDILDLSVNQD